MNPVPSTSQSQGGLPPIPELALTTLDSQQRSQIEKTLPTMFSQVRSLVLQYSGGSTGGVDSHSDSNSIPIEEPPESTKEMSPADYAYLAGMLMVDSANTMIQAQQETNKVLTEFQQDQAQQIINDITKQAEEASKANKKHGIMKIFGWVTSIVSIVVGAIMCATGVGAAAGAALIIGGVCGVVMQTKLGEDIMNGLTDAMTKLCGGNKIAGAIMAAVVMAAIMIALTVAGGSGVGALAGSVTRVSESVTSTVEIEMTEMSNVGSEVANTGEGVSSGSSISSVLSRTMGIFGEGAQAATNMKRAAFILQTMLNLSEQGLSSAVAVKELQLAFATKDVTLDENLFKQITNTIQMSTRGLQGALSMTEEGVSSACAVIGQLATTASAYGSGRA